MITDFPRLSAESSTSAKSGRPCVATWNLAWAKGAKASRLREEVTRHPADVWVLTETNESFTPAPEFKPVFSGTPDHDHKPGERWAAIWSRYEILGAVQTRDATFSACARLRRPDGVLLLIYATVLPWIGQHWRGRPSKGGVAFRAALEAQLEDWVTLQATYPEHRFCMAGDFNQDLASHRYYGSKGQRVALEDALRKAGLTCLTAGDNDPIFRATDGKHATIDHICVDAALASRCRGPVRCWAAGDDVGGGMTDHAGVEVHFNSDGETTD